MIDAISALTTVKSSLVSPGAGPVAGPSVGASAGTDFGQIMSQVSGDAIGNLKSAEAASIEGIKGGAPVHQVVEAIMSAQRSLQSTLAIRDKAVAAYQEISRMAI
jgi:flagellar hook-basal body complex protein FliE